MYVMEYLAYTFRPFGVSVGSDDVLPPKLTWEEIIENLESYERNVEIR